MRHYNWVFRKLDRDKDKLVCHEDLRAGSRYAINLTIVLR